jgi:hypothetical protein
MFGSSSQFSGASPAMDVSTPRFVWTMVSATWPALPGIGLSALDSRTFLFSSGQCPRPAVDHDNVNAPHHNELPILMHCDNPRAHSVRRVRRDQSPLDKKEEMLWL